MVTLRFCMIPWLHSFGIILLTINCLRSNNFQCLPNQQFLHKTNSSPTDGFHYLDLVMIRFSPASTQTNHRRRLIATSTESSDEASTHVRFERRTKVRWRWLKWHILEKNRKPSTPKKRKTRFRLEATRAPMAVTCSETFRLDSDVSRPQGPTTMAMFIFQREIPPSFPLGKRWLTVGQQYIWKLRLELCALCREENGRIATAIQFGTCFLCHT